MADKNKYKITDSDGAKAFLNSIRPIVRNDDTNQDDEMKARKRKIIRNGIIVGIVAIAAMALLSVFMYNVVQRFRSEEIKIREVIHESKDFEKRLMDDISSMDTFEETMSRADSLLGKINNLIETYPDEDTLKFLWSNVLLHKYEKYMHYSLKSHIFENIASLDSVDLQRVRQYHPEFLSVYTIIRTIPEFYHYKKKYPEPPGLASIAPPQWQINNLIEDAEMIQDTLAAQSILIEVHFPVLYTWLQYVNNYIVPELYVWRDFWDDYKEALKNEEAYSSDNDPFKQLKSSFPNLQILRTGSSLGLYTINEFSIGLVNNALTPPGSSLKQEWQPIIDFLRKEYGYDAELQLYNSDNELLSAILQGKVDIALLDIPTSTFAYYSKTGIPIAIRVWNGKNYINNILLSINKNIKDWHDIKGKSLAYFSSDLFSCYKFWEEHKQTISSLDLQVVALESEEKLVNGINKGLFDVLSLTEEEVYYLNHSGRITRQMTQLETLDPMPLDVVWVRDGLPASFVKKIQGILLSVTPMMIYNQKDAYLIHPYADWDKFDENIMRTYFHDIRSISLKYNLYVNKLHLMPVDISSDTTANKIQNALTQYLEKEGFAVLHHDEKGKKPIKPHDQVVTMKLNKKLNDNYEITLIVHKKFTDKDSVIYHDHFLINQNEDPRFEHKLFDLTKHLTVIGNVSFIGSSRVSIMTTVNTKMLLNKKITFFRPQYITDKSTKSYGYGTVVEVKPNILVVELDKHVLRHVRIGDLGVILNK